MSNGSALARSPKLQRIHKALQSRQASLRRVASDRQDTLVQSVAGVGLGYAERAGMLSQLPTFGLDPMYVVAALALVPAKNKIMRHVQNVGGAAAVISGYKLGGSFGG